MARTFDGRLPHQTALPLYPLLRDRYAATQCVGNGAWVLLLEALAPFLEAGGRAPSPIRAALIEDALMAFLAMVRPQRTRRRPRRLYIAFRQADIDDARRLAHLGSVHGMASWLDAYDAPRLLPGLKNRLVQDVLSIAAAEMGLLNASHVLVLPAPGLEGASGYLLGRARDHAALVRSTALWSARPLDWAHHASLVPLLQTEHSLSCWLDGLPAQPDAPVPVEQRSRAQRVGMARRSGGYDGFRQRAADS